MTCLRNGDTCTFEFPCLFKTIFSIILKKNSCKIDFCIIKSLLCFLAIVLMVFIDIYIAFSAEWKRDLAVSGTGNNPQNTMQYLRHQNLIITEKTRKFYKKFSMLFKDSNVVEWLQHPTYHSPNYLRRILRENRRWDGSRACCGLGKNLKNRATNFWL